MYRASSVLRALSESEANTIGYKFIKCPLDRCYISPVDCYKAQNQTCVQELTVLYKHDNHNKVVNLRFYFTISLNDHDGFIDSDNEFLQLLIRRGIISKVSIERTDALHNDQELLFQDI